MAREILTGARIFDGRRLIDGHALVIDNGEISAILPQDKVPDRNRREVPGIIAPAFIDLQVNGGGGVMVDGATNPVVLLPTVAAGDLVAARSWLHRSTAGSWVTASRI